MYCTSVPVFIWIEKCNSYDSGDWEFDVDCVFFFFFGTNDDVD
jgi:hypothetical protein